MRIYNKKLLIIQKVTLIFYIEKLDKKKGLS